MKTSRRNILRDGGRPLLPARRKRRRAHQSAAKLGFGKVDSGDLLLMLILFLLWREGDQLDWVLLLGLALLFLRDSDP